MARGNFRKGNSSCETCGAPQEKTELRKINKWDAICQPCAVKRGADWATLPVAHKSRCRHTRG